jgi:hypothetical protein
MGFSRSKVIRALEQHDYNMDKSLNALLAAS